jgi:dihydrofolate reductase
MAKIVISENISLDGVVQDPTGEEGFSRGGWFGEIGDDDRAAWAEAELDEALGSEALLFGRLSYEFFAARWPTRSGAWAERLNGMPKYVVSSRLENPEWNNSSVLKGDPVGEVSKLKRQLSGDVVVYASFQLGRALLEQGLVDELRLTVYPVVVGAGERLFGNSGGKHPLRLLETRTVGESLASLTYEVVHDGER